MKTRILILALVMTVFAFALNAQVTYTISLDATGETETYEEDVRHTRKSINIMIEQVKQLFFSIFEK